VSLTNINSYNFLQFNDDEDTTARNIAITNVNIGGADYQQSTGLIPGVVRYATADTAGVSYFTGQGADTISVPATNVPIHVGSAAGIDSLTVGHGTAIGAAMLKGLDAIAEVNPNVAPVGDAPPATVGPPGAKGFVPDIVVLLTDGANTRGIKPLEAVPYAVERGVRVYTIGFGTTQPAAMVCSRTQLGGAALGGDGGFNGGGFRGGGGQGGSPLVADEATLQAVADQTGGQHYTAPDTGAARSCTSRCR